MNYSTLKIYFKKKHFILSIFFGSLSFIFLYGIKIITIDPQTFYDFDYLAYRTSFYAILDSEWSKPLFNSDRFFHDKNINLFFADYIPLYTILLKAVKSFFLLENPFLFWIYLSTILTFYFSYKIFNKSNNINYLHKIVGSTVITTLPLVPLKYIYHSGEGAHWLIIMSIYFYLESSSNKKILYIFSICAALSIWVHFYLFTIVVSIFFLTLIKNYRNIKVVSKSILLFLTINYILFYLTFENFQSFNLTLNNEIMTDFNPRWSAETNSFFCGRSSDIIFTDILKCYEPYTNSNYEAYSFLGLGILVFSLLVFFEFKNSIKILTQQKEIIALGIIFLFFSFGNRIKLAHKQIFEYNFSEIHYFFIKIYRAHARFSYLAYYLIAFFIVFKILKFSKINLIHKLFFCSFLFIQFFSVSNELNSKEFESYGLDFSNNEIIQISNSVAKYVDERLYIYPPDNCLENNDMYLFASVFIKNGGNIHTSRIRGGNSFENCIIGLNIEKNLIQYKPFHFLINSEIYLLPESFMNKYFCKTIKGFFYDQDFYYCYKK